MVERSLSMWEVRGSMPRSSKDFFFCVCLYTLCFVFFFFNGSFYNKHNMFHIEIYKFLYLCFIWIYMFIHVMLLKKQSVWYMLWIELGRVLVQNCVSRWTFKKPLQKWFQTLICGKWSFKKDNNQHNKMTIIITMMSCNQNIVSCCIKFGCI